MHSGKTAPYRIATLDTTHHNRREFNSETPALDRYLREQISQDIKRRVAACFVALSDDDQIAGYYTLSAASVPLLGLPETTRRRLPRYGTVPAIRMGRLAVDRQFKGQGLGGTLLVDALRRAASSEIPAAVLVVDAKDGRAAAFYAHHGFVALSASPLTLFLPLATIKR